MPETPPVGAADPPATTDDTRVVPLTAAGTPCGPAGTLCGPAGTPVGTDAVLVVTREG